ncbi:MAG TPA: alpha/beta hydrolase-fold protein [Acidobacteriaceae bacterium]|nr:alpha/beta hydrolase-fold protein [Acidobacteriaceae bacterium]
MPPPEKFERWEPVELSDPAYEHENVRNLTLYSSALRGRADVSLYVPPEWKSISKIPIVLLLHGVYGSHWSWFFSGGAHRTAQRLITEGRIRPMLLVSPSDGLSGDGSGYLPQPDRNYESWICEDVVGCVQQLFQPATSGGSVFISGLSMGGYGALRMGAKYAGKFRGIAAHSAVTRIEELDDFIRDPIPTEKFTSAEADILYWMRRNRDILPPIRFDCGTEDALFNSNQKLHLELDRENIPHDFFAHPGGHEWPYWQTHIADTLLFFESILKANSWKKP